MVCIVCAQTIHKLYMKPTLRDKKTKRLRVKESKSGREEESKRLRVKETKRQRDKETEPTPTPP